ncbi:MAG: hypothetical protein QF357_07415 [Dehalococcoidia bacterium]|jgi:GNAT superfamily N-acetyltransferase|nr:hypothetical protein [Dehalococcoidia bacterium]
MTPGDYRTVESVHWSSAGQVADFVDRQGLASILAYESSRYLGQLYLQEYDPSFIEPGGWEGHRPYADFRVAEPLSLKGRYLTIGCFHVGWMPDGQRESSLWGRGIGQAMLGWLVDWFRDDGRYDGLLAWAVSPASRKLLRMAGQMPHTVYRRNGFREIKRLRDSRWGDLVAEWAPHELQDELSDLCVMTLDR